MQRKPASAIRLTSILTPRCRCITWVTVPLTERISLRGRNAVYRGLMLRDKIGLCRLPPSLHCVSHFPRGVISAKVR